MKTISPEELQKLCDDHWEYVEQVILQEYDHPEEFLMDTYLKAMRFHYTTAMAHGFKHGVQWIKEKIRIGEWQEELPSTPEAWKAQK